MSGKTGPSQGLPIYNSCDYMATSTITLFISFIHYQRISEDFKKKIEFHEGVHWTSSSNVLLAQPVLLTGGEGGGGGTWEFLVEVCRPVLQILTLFQTKNIIFTSFQTWPLKSIPILRPAFKKLCHHY